MRKKKVLFQSDSLFSKTGFSRNLKELMKYLYNTKKYDLVAYGCGSAWDNPNHKSFPWKSFGTMPNTEEELKAITGGNEAAISMVSYGKYNLDKIIKQEKPDVYIAIQDIWGINYAIQKPWFDKISCALWTTLDSLPILPMATEAAKKCNNFWVWSSFAEEAMKKDGLDHVKTVHGALNTSQFYKLTSNQKRAIRKRNGISNDCFIPGFVFRNQLRKSLPNLLQAFRSFKDQNPTLHTKLLLHTHWNEEKGWDIPRLIEQYNLLNEDILTTYLCKFCGNYFIKNYYGQGKQCDVCKSKDSLITANTQAGVHEEQLNEIYNIMDCLVHPFTSGGQEIPIQEAKLCELITLVTNYSCGEEMCSEGACSIPLTWSKYTEIGSQFIKASTDVDSIVEGLNKVLNMGDIQKIQMGSLARKWVIDNFSVESVGGFIEKFIDESPYIMNEDDVFSRDFEALMERDYNIKL